MIFLAGHYDVCRRYAWDSRLGQERVDWVHVRDEYNLQGIVGKHLDPASPHYMIVLYYSFGYFHEDDNRFFEMARLRGLLPRPRSRRVCI